MTSAYGYTLLAQMLLVGRGSHSAHDLREVLVGLGTQTDEPRHVGVARQNPARL